ncbi:MAG: substrate-binding domain-containing protein [Anaerocolumna aminovalerica]|jgi:ribose transport system substrate-binding protein|uniref:sugar ABC transporter substrate-binding protein n=1 Tax=Anaerocolumna aminovalerica TaxID=1527 RepID=UPI001C0EE3EF|nr:substrate-binding domain-containing protein [Anaerocolumna aminovalerica]MBU5332184.1 substrate-binding domain-containing protein [Anaerocolumna aminovalerica]MDU6266349.1 substrate-binding domain-containing protein [Anaerocolumna aminovalerica]
MLKGIFGTLIGMLLLIVVMFGQLMINVDNKTAEKEPVEKPDYHIQIVIQNTDEYFWTLFQEGAKAAEKEFGTYVEFVRVPQRDTKYLQETVEMGANAGVDAIALQAADSEETIAIIEGATKQGIVLLTYENDNVIIPNTPMVGSNSYSIGNMAGDMAVEASGGSANVAVILNDSGEQSDEQYKNLIVQGILESFSQYSTINIEKIYTINADMFEAEKISSSIISESDKVDMIICLDERSTPGVAQVLVDSNMVGDVKLIGYGVAPQTLDYIDKGVIYGTVCPKAYDIGYYTVKQITSSLKGEQISDYISTDLFSINKNNMFIYEDKFK